ncbi:hypothetical protein HY385_00955 [Candidatus Daviesbacteria bacterium]|nr:hypothetical protein [Candidatus Daviesbacteria bacterium]
MLKFALTWYVTVVCSLAFALLFLIYSTVPHTLAFNEGGYKSYRALPTSADIVSGQTTMIGKADARPILIKNFFAYNKAPLADLADEFVATADRYNLDFRLLPSIAMQESNGGKIIPKGSYNPFGYGVYGGKAMKFTSFAEAIDRVGKGLKENYLNQGLKTPYQIMTKYTPPSIQKGGPWALGVSAFMEQLL